jgi:hypothetical protein
LISTGVYDVKGTRNEVVAGNDWWFRVVYSPPSRLRQQSSQSRNICQATVHQVHMVVLSAPVEK